MALPHRPAVVVALCGLLLCASVLATGGARASDLLTLGRISDDPRNHYAQLKPLLDYIVPRMRDVGIRRGRILMARDVRQLANYLRRDSVDWVTETPGMALQLEALAGAQPLVLTERSGVAEYRSLVIVRRDSGIAGPADLAGQAIAFEHPASTSAYLVPALELVRRGMTLEPLTALGDTPQGNGIGYLFARSEANIAIWVDKGLVAAGAISDLGWANRRTVPESLLGSMTVIHRSEPFPRALELVRGNLDPRVRERLRQLLLAAADDADAAPALREFFGTTAFLPIDPSLQQRLRDLRTGLERVHLEVE